MFGVFIVDDEKLVRQSVRTSINWEENEFEIIGEEDDGLEALSKIIDLRPHIVICDIRMPGMEGIELFKSAKTKFPHIIFIFISGYSQFNYVQEALNAGAASYILKPIEESKLLAALNQAKEKLKEEEIRFKEKYLARKAVDNLKNQFFIQLFNGSNYTMKNAQSMLSDLNIRFTGEWFLVLSVAIDNYQKMKSNLSSQEMRLLEFALINISQEVISGYGLSSFFINMDEENTIVFNFAERERTVAENLIRKSINDILIFVKKYQYFTVTIGVGNVVYDLTGLKESYVKSRRCLGYRLILGSNRAIQEEDCAGHAEVVDLLPFQLESQLIHGLEQLSIRIIDGVLDEIYGIFMNIANRSPQQIMLINRHIISLIYLTASRKGIPVEAAVGDQFALLKKMDDLDHIELMKAEMKRIASSFIGAETLAGKSDEMAIVKNMKEYVYLHYREKIDLQSIAGKLYMHPVYLSKVFKQETGENFTDFLVRYRMNISKNLMKNMKYDLVEIARMVGYEDYTYFYKVFKKVIGIAPIEYRKSIENHH